MGEPQNDIENRVVRVIAENLRVLEGVTPEMSLAGELDADSLDLVDIVLDLEQEFGIQVPDDVERQWTTVADVIRYVQGALA